MSIFHQKNPSFRTLDLLWVVILVGVVGSISGAILADALHDDSPRRARAGAEVLASQLRILQSAASKPQSRGPASEDSSEATQARPLTSGQMGRDPWGNPFHYLVKKTSAHGGSGSMVRIFVWSDGPDGKADSDPSAFEAKIETDRPQQIHFRGDDVGVLEEFAQDI